MGKIIVSQLDLNTEQAYAGTVILCTFALLCAWATYVFIENGFKQGFHREDYYTLTKDGKAIKFKLKDDKSEYLQKQAEVKIIDEDNKTYQIQYKDTIDRVPKSAVK